MKSGKVLLPLEGDRTLLMIPKQGVPAGGDDRIKDETITQQINCKK